MGGDNATAHPGVALAAFSFGHSTRGATVNSCDSAMHRGGCGDDEVCSRKSCGLDDLDLTSQPNDAYFKQVFSDPQRAALFFQSHLDASVAALIEWSSLKLEPGSFVKQTLQQSHSDLLFTARLGERELKLFARKADRP